MTDTGNSLEKMRCIPYEKMNSYQRLCHDHGVSSMIGLQHKMLIIAKKNKKNREQLIAAGFLAIPEPPPSQTPPEQKPFSEWEKKHQAKIK